MLQAEDLSLQKQVLRRIKMLIEMMGSQLGTYVPKLMVLLMHAIDKESLQNEGLSVLHFFIEQLANKSPSSTKHVISQVFAALIPFLERYKENPSTHLNKAVNILEELVLKNRTILKQHIHEFPLLPSISELMKVNKAIQEARGSMTLKDQLRDVVDGLNHENFNVSSLITALLRGFQSAAIFSSECCLSSKKQASKSKGQGSISSTDQDQLLVQCKYVSELLTAIPKLTHARASFRCQA
ncbi:hypothetical protein NC652_011769 [Populus alba x Populus x berolinensis]|nr:hypothetical protein NC652_011769 [Populus alba x Populus x berolinensis]